VKALLLGNIPLDPAKNGRVIDVLTPLPHHLLQVAIAERIAQVPTHTQQNDLGLEMTPFEWTWILHEGNSSTFID